MATVNKSTADALIASDGYYPGDPRVARIIEYTNHAGQRAYAIEYDWEIGRYLPSPYVHNPKVLWEAK